MSRIDGGVTLDLCLEVLMKTPHLVNYDQGGGAGGVAGGGWYEAEGGGVNCIYCAL